MTMGKHKRFRKMYDTMRCDYDWQFMSDDFISTVSEWKICTRTRGTLSQHQKHLLLFPPAGTLEIVAINLRNNKHVSFSTDRYSKLSR